MKPIEKTANDLFQMLRSRFSPVSLGDDQANATSDPRAAVFFSFPYKEGKNNLGSVSVSIVNRRNLKIYFTNDMIENMTDSSRWYDFLRELRLFARSNLLGFDARDIGKAQMDSADYKTISLLDGPYQQQDFEIKESALTGTLRKSYQRFESGVRLLVNHSSLIDPAVPGARSRRIDSMFIERADGERYRVPFKHLNGARGLAAHVSAGGTPYDTIGEHIVQTVQEMQDLRDFARLTRRVAMENADADSVRSSVKNRYIAMREHLKKLQNSNYYQNFVENFQPPATVDGLQDIEALREKFTRRVWNEKVEKLLPTVLRTLEDTTIFGDIKMQQHTVTEASGSIERMIRDPNVSLVLKKDPAADRMISTMRFNDGNSLLVYVLGDIAARAMGDQLDALANFAGEMSDRIGSEGDAFASNKDANYKRDKSLAIQLAKRYIDDLKRMQSDSEYTDAVRQTPEQVYGSKRKRGGGTHEAAQFEAWADQTTDVFSEHFDEAATVGTTGTVGTSAAVARPNPQVLKTLGGGDPQKTRMLKTVGDKLVRGTRLNPKEREIADELAGELITTKRPAAAAQTIASSVERDAPAMQEKQLVIKDNDDDQTEEPYMDDDEMKDQMQEALISMRRLAGL